MDVQFTSAEEALCPHLKNTAGREEHVLQPHLPISSIPSPDEPLSIGSFPIEIHTQTATFNPKNIANLWLQLLSLHVHNGNFWTYKSVLEAREEKLKARDASTSDSKPKKSPLDEKHVFFIRYKLQKGFLNPDKKPSKEDLPGLSGFLKRLEDNWEEITPEIYRSVKIPKVLKHILKLDEIPGEEEFGFRRRCKDLRTKLLSMLDAAPIEVETSTERNSEASAENQRAEAEVVGVGEYVQPAVCLTQLTPEQCNRIEEMTKACNPPLDRAVVELMCILPYFSTSAKYGGDRYQVAPQANLTRLPEKLDTIDRGLYPGGPTIPPHMLRLTNWPGRIGGLGTALLVDIRSGETLELRDFEDNASGEVCKTFEGPRRPVEDHLKEWIDNLLTMKWIPSGGDDIATDEWRSMEYLKHKALLQEYGWPSSFPLGAPQFHEFLRRKDEVYREALEHRQNHVELHSIWWRLIQKCYKNSANGQFTDKIRLLDHRINDALKYHEDRNNDREYALAADVPMQRQLRSPLILPTGERDGWNIEYDPSSIMERFNEVLDEVGEGEDTEKMEEMKMVIESAYFRWTQQQKGIYECDNVEGEDDDSTSDFDPIDEDEFDEVEEYVHETDEEEDNLEFDIVILEDDMKTDIEDIRRALEGFQVSGQ